MPEATARAAVTIRAPRDRVWTALTEPEQIRRYFLGGAEFDTDWKVGNPIVFRGEWKGQPFEDKGEIVTFDPEHEVAYSHYSPMTGKPDEPESYDVVDITLEADGDRTTVTLEQRKLTGEVTAEDRDGREQFERNWQQMLQGLRETVES
jgi:uncharacterized protein YndB with AHSA1/START domain